jgi:hypothetical protein
MDNVFTISPEVYTDIEYLATTPRIKRISVTLCHTRL